MRPWIFLCLLLATRLAWGALDSEPTPADGAAVQTARSLTSAGVPYTEVRRTLPSQVVVREYLDASGKVFALSWSGPFKPDLKQLLGPHFEKYREESGRRGPGERARQQVDTGEAIVVSAGHMGAFEGRAWLPARLPAGFDPQEMK